MRFLGDFFFNIDSLTDTLLILADLHVWLHCSKISHSVSQMGIALY